jgi:hypothetical protein
MKRPLWQRTSSMANVNNKHPMVSVAIASLWRSLRKDLFDTYRPELHYMRGPGPRWRAKHQQVRPQVPVVTGLADAAI